MTGATLKESATVATLKEAFTSFARSAEELSTAYRELEARASRVDGELGHANATLRAILESIPSGLVARDGRGRVTVANRAAETILGLSLAELARDAAPGGAADPLLPAEAPKTPLACERTLVTRDGRTVHLLWTRSPLALPGEAGGHGTLEIFTDVTELRRLQAELVTRERLAALGETAAALAHQVRNPLNGFRGFLGLLLRELAHDRDGRARCYAEKIFEGARELERVVESFLGFARPERLDRRPTRLLALVDEAAGAVEAAGGPRGGVTVDVRPATLSVLVDPTRLKQVLVNLLENAFEAAGPDRAVVVRARGDGAGAVIEVEDAGPGIAPHLLPRLFQPFATNKAGGSGLGLAYARKVVELHGGRIRAENRAGRGACFTIELDRKGERGR